MFHRNYKIIATNFSTYVPGCYLPAQGGAK